jgi:hypothetical protein
MPRNRPIASSSRPIGLDKKLGVRGDVEAVAKRQQFFTELDIVVDLAIEGDGKSTVVARHGLMPAANIYDREAAMAQTDLEAPFGDVAQRVAGTLRPTISH